jgi:hypothetical protein
VRLTSVAQEARRAAEAAEAAEAAKQQAERRRTGDGAGSKWHLRLSPKVKFTGFEPRLWVNFNRL